MLNFIRRAARTWVIKLLLGLLVVAFASWGIADVFTNVSGQGVATIGDESVTQAEFAQAFQNELNARQRDGQMITQEEAIAAGLDDMVLNRLVFQAALAKAARDAGVRISNARVARAIADLPMFRNEIGFDRLSFQQLLVQINMTEAQLTELIRADEARSLLLDSVTGPLTVPDVMVNLYYGYETETRSADFFQIDAGALEVAEPTEDDVMAYYESNSDQFMAPEYRRFTAVSIRQADLEDEIQVSEEEMQTAYQNAAAQYSVPESRTLAQIVVNSQEEAQRLYDEIQGGADFEAVAEQAGKTSEDITLGDMTLRDLEGINLDLAARAFALQEPGVTEPVQTPFGWHIVQVSAIREASTQPLEEVRDELRRGIVAGQVLNMVYDLSNRVQDALASGSTLEEVAEEFNLRIETPPLMDRSGFGPDGTRVADAPRASIIRQAFETEPGAYPELREDGEDYAVVRVDEVVPETVRPFEDVRDQARTAILETRHREAARAQAEELKARAETGESLEGLAEEVGAVFRQVGDVGRNGINAPAIFGAEAMQALFGTPVDGVTTAVGSDGQDHVVVRVTGVTRQDASQDVAGRTQLTSGLEDMLYTQMLEQLRLALFEKYDVRVYPQVAARAINPDIQ